MIFYLFPRDTFVGIATYPSAAVPNLEVSDTFLSGVTLLNYYPPTAVRLEIPSAVYTYQALGYQSLAALGDAALNPHQWTFQFPLVLSISSKSFLSFALTYLGLSRPVAVWAIARSPSGQEFTYFVSPIAVLSEINLQVPNSGNASFSLTFSSPFALVVQSGELTLGVMRPVAANERGLLIRDLLMTTRIGLFESEGEILSLSLNARRQVNWVWTTFHPLRHSLGARRAATMFTTTAITPRGSITLGYPIGFSLLQNASLQPMKEVTFRVRNLMAWTLIGLKATSWAQDFSTGAAGITVNFSYMMWLVS
jgi:hypothetical protein